MFFLSLFSCNCDDQLSPNFHRFVIWCVEIHQVRILVFDNYQSCPVPFIPLPMGRWVYMLCIYFHWANNWPLIDLCFYSWHVLHALQALGYSHISEQDLNHLHVSFASQLEGLGLWHWAVFVLLHIQDNCRWVSLYVSVIKGFGYCLYDTKHEVHRFTLNFNTV